MTSDLRAVFLRFMRNERPLHALRLGMGTSVVMLGNQPEHMGDALHPVELNNLRVREVHECA